MTITNRYLKGVMGKRAVNWNKPMPILNKREETLLGYENHQLFGTYLIWRHGHRPKSLLPHQTYYNRRIALLEYGIDINSSPCENLT